MWPMVRASALADRTIYPANISRALHKQRVLLRYDSRVEIFCYRRADSSFFSFSLSRLSSSARAMQKVCLHVVMCHVGLSAGRKSRERGAQDIDSRT